MVTRNFVAACMFAAAVLAAHSAAQGASIAIVNPSFENPTTHRGGTDLVPGWIEADTSFYASGVWAPTVGSDYAAIPDGTQVAFVTRGGLSQTLAATLTANTFYELLVDVGRSALDPLPATSFEIGLWAGGNLLAHSAIASPSLGSFLTIDVSYTASAADALLGQMLEIRLLDTGATGSSDVNFDNVRLDANVSPVDEPPTLGLLLLGAISLVHRRRAGSATVYGHGDRSEPRRHS